MNNTFKHYSRPFEYVSIAPCSRVKNVTFDINKADRSFTTVCIRPSVTGIAITSTGYEKVHFFPGRLDEKNEKIFFEEGLLPYFTWKTTRL